MGDSGAVGESGAAIGFDGAGNPKPPPLKSSSAPPPSPPGNTDSITLPLMSSIIASLRMYT